MLSEISQTEKDKNCEISVLSEKYNKLVNITKKKQTHRYREQTSGYYWGRGNIGVGEWEIQTMGCKIGSWLYCTTWGIEPIFCNNYKWKVTFKNCIKIKKIILFNYCCCFKSLNPWKGGRKGGYYTAVGNQSNIFGLVYFSVLTLISNSGQQCSPSGVLEIGGVGGHIFLVTMTGGGGDCTIGI